MQSLNIALDLEGIRVLFTFPMVSLFLIQVTSVCNFPLLVKKDCLRRGIVSFSEEKKISPDAIKTMLQAERFDLWKIEMDESWIQHYLGRLHIETFSKVLPAEHMSTRREDQ